MGEVSLLRVADLRSAQFLKPNDLFFEVHLGFNEVMCTRVLYGVGEDSVVKQTVQLNFDDSDSYYDLIVLAKHQDVVGSDEVARKVFSTEDVAEMMSEPGQTWNEQEFQEVSLQPQGKLWIRIAPVD